MTKKNSCYTFNPGTVLIRQNLTSEDGPRAESVKFCSLLPSDTAGMSRPGLQAEALPSQRQQQSRHYRPSDAGQDPRGRLPGQHCEGGRPRSGEMRINRPLGVRRW